VFNNKRYPNLQLGMLKLKEGETEAEGLKRLGVNWDLSPGSYDYHEADRAFVSKDNKADETESEGSNAITAIKGRLSEAKANPEEDMREGAKEKGKKKDKNKKDEDPLDIDKELKP